MYVHILRASFLSYLCGGLLITFAGCHFTQKRAFQACMGHGGARFPPKKVIQHRMSAGQGFPADFQPASPDFHPCWVIFSVTFSGFQPRTPLKAPSKKGLPCCQPLGPTFVNPKARLPGLAVGTVPQRARARVLTIVSTRDP